MLIKNEIIFQLVFINDNLLNDFVICTPDRQFHFYGTFKYNSLRRLTVLNYRCVRDLFNNMSFLIRPFRAFPTESETEKRLEKLRLILKHTDLFLLKYNEYVEVNLQIKKSKIYDIFVIYPDDFICFNRIKTKFRVSL